MQELYDRAFARLDRVSGKRQEFAQCWATYISVHPWDIDVRSVDSSTLEILAVMREPSPVELALIFSEWLAALRASLDNAIYALAAAITGQNPPPQAERIQYPICSTPAEFTRQAKRLAMLPPYIIEAFEKSQPYQSPWGPESNLTWWVNELARKDRHRALHVGLGCVDEHRIRVALPSSVTITFDETVEPYSHIERELVVGRFYGQPTAAARGDHGGLDWRRHCAGDPGLGRLPLGRQAAVARGSDGLHRNLHAQPSGEHGPDGRMRAA